MDHYILDFARIYFATAQRGMTIAETTFAVQRPHYLVEEYARMIEQFGLDGQRVYDRTGVGMAMRDDRIEPSLAEDACQNERREQEEPLAL